MIYQLAIILGCLSLGELIVWLTGTSIPSSIIGLIILVLALECKVVKPVQIERISDFFLKNMGLFFVPAGVGLLSYLGLISTEIVPITIATVVSTIIVLIVTSLVHKTLLKK